MLAASALKSAVHLSYDFSIKSPNWEAVSLWVCLGKSQRPADPAMTLLAPYLKNPAPCESLPAGFRSYHDCKPLGQEEPICPGQAFNSYGAWFQAHQPKEVAPSTTVRTTKASSYWPYGRGVTSIIGSRNNHDVLIIDNARSRGTLPYRPRDAETQRRFHMGNGRNLWMNMEK